MGVNDREKAKLEQEIAELRRKQAKAVEVDKTLDAALSKMRDEVRGYDDKYDEQVKRKKEALEKKKFSSSWDPKLTEALEIVRKPLQSYGENCEKAVAKLLKAIEKGLENGASDYKATRCVEAALSVLSDAENCTISFYQISKTLKYQPTYEGRSTKRSLEKIKKDLSSGAGTIESQIKTREEKIRRIEKADKYGVTLDKLDTHESYLTAVKNYEKATTGDQLRASAKDLKALGSYLNSKILFEECDKKVKAIEEVEKAEKAVADAKKNLSDAEKELKAAESDKSGSESELKNSESELQKIEAGVDGEKSSVVGEYTRNCNQNNELVAKQNAELDALIAQKTEAEFALSKTFFLAFGKKKELNARIASLSTSIDDKKKEIEETKKKKDAYLRTQNNKLNAIDAKVSAAREKAKDASSKLRVATQRLEKAKNSLETAKSNLEKANQNYDSVISKKKKDKEAQRKAEEARRQAEAEAQRKAEEARRQAEAEAQRKAEEARRQAEAEAQRKAEEAKRQAEVEAQRKAEEAKRESESAAQRKEVEETKYRVEQEKQKKEGEDSLEMSDLILPNVDAKLARLIEKLEKWYPEHKAYAMDNIDKKLREDVAAYAKAHGKSVEQLLASVGFEIISGQAVYELRHPKLTRPGQEPEVIKSKIDNILSGLLEYYPDKKISRSIQNDHKAIAGRISGAYQWLGYASVEDFLVAYGFDYSVAQSGRPTGDYDAIINALKAKYPDGPKFSKLGDLVADNPDLAGKIKTINNKANELFGMSLAKYFQSIGILTPMSASQIAENERKARVDLLVESLMERYPNGSEFTSIEAIRKDNEDLEGWDDITERILQNRGLIRRQKFINTCRVNLVAEGREIVCELKRKFRNLRNVGVYALILDNDGKQTYGTVISDAEEVEVMDLPCDISEVWTIIDVATGEDICRKIFESAVENVGAKINEFTHALTLSADGKKAIRYEEGKNKLKDILVIPDGVEEIGDEVLRNARFKELHINAELKIIGAKTLLDDEGRIKETISKILISSENDTFVKDETGVYEVRSEGKKLLMCLNKMAGAEIVLDEDVTSVAPGAFSRSQYIKSIILHSNVEDVGGDPENFGAINIIIDESSNYLFNDEDSIYKILSDGTYKLISCRYRGKGRALILNGTSVIGDFAFKGCTGFKSIQLPSSVKYIGTGAFANCSIQELDIPSTVKRIGDKAFSFNGGLSRVNLPVELEDVEVKAFYGCNMLNEITENGKKGIYSVPNWGEKILTYHGPVREKTDDVSVLTGEVHADKSVNKVNATVQKVYDIMAPIMKEVVTRRTHENDSIYLDEENQAVVIRACLDQKAESQAQANIRVAVADKLKVGDPLELRLDRSRSWVFWEFKYKGQSVADDMEFIAEKLKHLLTKLDVSATVAEVIPKSQRGKGCKYALVSAEITIKEKMISLDSIGEVNKSEAENDFEYIIEDGKAYILSWKGHADKKKLVFPAKIEGKPVAEIDKRVFESVNDGTPGVDNVEIVEIENGITKLQEGNLRIENFNNLKYVIIPDSVTTFDNGEYFDIFGYSSNTSQLERLVFIVSPTSKAREYIEGYKGYLEYPLTVASNIEEAVEIRKTLGILKAWDFEENGKWTIEINEDEEDLVDFYSEVVEVPELVFGQKVIEYRGGELPECVRKLILPRHLKKIEGLRCQEYLQEFIVSKDNERFSSDGIALYSKDGSKLISVVVASSDTFVVPEGTKVIGANAFSYYEKLKKIILPKTLERIEGWAFSGCDNLAEVQGLDDVKNVDTNAFGWGGFKKK